MRPCRRAPPTRGAARVLQLRVARAAHLPPPAEAARPRRPLDLLQELLHVSKSPTAHEEDMVVDLIERIQPDVVAMSVWSTYYQLAARLSARIKAACNPVIIWGGIHPQTRPEQSPGPLRPRGAQRGRVRPGRADRPHGASARTGTTSAATWTKRDGEIVQNPPRFADPRPRRPAAPDLSSEQQVLSRQETRGATWPRGTRRPSPTTS